MKKTLHVLWMILIGAALQAQTPVYEFNFDGSMANSGTGVFGGWTTSGSGSVSYVNDRSGQANKAMQMPSTLIFNGASAPGLPTGNGARTLSFWAKFINDDNAHSYPVTGWGNNAANQAFGFWRNGMQNSYYTWGAGNDYNIPQTNAQIQASNNGWVHIAMTHDSNVMTIYYNGVDAGHYNRVLNTLGADLYLNRLVNANNGTGSAIQIDDLKIYNTALTAEQIVVLYNPAATSMPPTVSNIRQSSTTSDSATIHFDVNPGGASSSSYVSVTEIGAGFGSVLDGPVASGTTTQSLSYTITGLTPGKCYTFNVMMYNSAGSSPVSADQAFCTYDAEDNKTPVYHFEFNGNTQDKNDPTLAFANPNSGYTDNNTAIRLNNNVQSISLPLIAKGGERRTVAIRVFFESGALAQENNVFSYGSAANGQSFGYNQNSQTGTLYYWVNDVQLNSPMSSGTWYTMVFTYDGMDTKVFKNGVQIASGSATPNTIGSLFRLGRTTTGVGGYFNGRIDDLRIYNESFNSSDAASLHQALSKESFKDDLLFSMSPNPATTAIRIDLPETQTLEAVTVYSLQGQKLLTAKETVIDIAHLPAGVYLVEVLDAKGAKATKKLIVE